MKTSRKLSWSELKVGMVVIVSLALLAVGILQLGGNAGFFTKNYSIFVRLDNTFGLKVGNTVRLAGIDIGNIEDISLPADPNDQAILIKLKLQEKYRERVREDSRVNIRTLGLLGDKYVEISVGSPKANAIADGGTLSGYEETQINKVLAGASTGIEGLNTVMGQLRDVMQEIGRGEGTAGLLIKDPKLYRELTDAAENIDVMAKNLRSGKGSLGKLVNETELYDNLVAVSEKTRIVAEKLSTGSLVKLSDDQEFYQNLHDVSGDLKDVTRSSKTFMANLESGNLAKLSADKELYDKLKSATDRLDRVLARLDGGSGSAGKLLTDEQLYNDMDKFFKDADALVLDMKEHPSKYVNFSIF
ncbi:MAG: MCE family protein [Nitrospirae bacterium]|nr:MCE family protein [Nitrospirota bacterium]